MAQISYDAFKSVSENVSNAATTAPSGVGYFYLRDDGDEAIVRIMHNSPEDFDIVAVHQVAVDGRTRNVSCVRDPDDFVDRCPLCQANFPLRYRMYVHLLVYTTDENGQLVATPKVWDRPASFSANLSDKYNEYGPLSNLIYKIKRHGKAGSTDTTYEVFPANAQVYRPELYPIPEGSFANYRTVGSVVLDKSYEELAQALAAGEYTLPTSRFGSNPQQKNARSTAPAQPQASYSAPTQASAPSQVGTISRAYNNAPQPQNGSIPRSSSPTSTPTSRPAPSNADAPAEQGNVWSRPRRSYQPEGF